MKMNFDDPKLTAFALGELSGEEFSAVEKQVAQSPAAQAYVHETQQLARELRNEFRAELDDARPLNILPLPAAESFWSDSRWWSIGWAAALGAGALIAAILFFGQRSQRPLAANARVQDDVIMEVVDPASEFQNAAPASESENQFVSTAAQRVSTFSLRVGDTSYENIRRAIASNRRPPKEAVRLEEMINHFSYEFPPSPPNESFSFALDLATCPWRPEHRLARVGLQATKTLADAKVEVEFNPTRVLAYRLLGYEERGQGRTDQPANRAVTALYEIIPTKNETDSIWLTTRVEHEGRQSEHSLGGEAQDFAQAPADFRFAAAVAEFGMILRDSPHKGNAMLSNVLASAETARGRDETGERAGFVELVRKAQTLAF